MKIAYKKQFDKFGYNPKSLGWVKGRQQLRFEALTKNIKTNNSSLLDFGCGFGDLSQFLLEKKLKVDYTGLDCMKEFISVAKEKHEGNYILADTIDDKITNNFDYIICSGVFNFLYDENIKIHEDIVFSIISNLFESCNSLLSVDFQSPFVDFKSQNSYHQDITSLFDFIRNKLSKRFSFDHSYMPYEFCVHIFKDSNIKTPENIFYGSSRINSPKR